MTVRSDGVAAPESSFTVSLRGLISSDLAPLREVHKEVCALVDACNEEARKADIRKLMGELEKR